MQPSFFVNHGGGPCFSLEPGPMRQGWSDLETYLRGFAARLETKPSAILVVSGHWETTIPTVNVGANPRLLFDYNGFPAHTYQLRYDAPGAPDLAAKVQALLGDAGIDSATDATRGWDHGVFVPLMVMFPDADIPVVQLSMQRDLDPAAHLAIGRALAPLRAENVLIVGSGESYHNMAGFFAGPSPSDRQAQAFDDWLCTTIADPDSREAALTNWTTAPGARVSHPEEDHLLPLMVAAGAGADAAGHVDFRGRGFGKPLSGFRFG